MMQASIECLPLLILTGIFDSSHEKYHGDGNTQCQHDTGGQYSQVGLSVGELKYGTYTRDGGDAGAS